MTALHVSRSKEKMKVKDCIFSNTTRSVNAKTNSIYQQSAHFGMVFKLVLENCESWKCVKKTVEREEKEKQSTVPYWYVR